jgi:hypothetical protein
MEKEDDDARTVLRKLLKKLHQKRRKLIDRRNYLAAQWLRGEKYPFEAARVEGGIAVVDSIIKSLSITLPEQSNNHENTESDN